MSLKQYNNRIAPIISSIVDRYYISDIYEYSKNIHATDTEIRAAIKTYRDTPTDKHLEILFNMFTRYVLSIAKNYQRNGLVLSDLISEGMLGLYTAFEKFDLEGDVKFITYSNVVITRAILEALDENNYIVKLPKNIRVDINKQKEKASKDSKLDSIPKQTVYLEPTQSWYEFDFKDDTLNDNIKDTSLSKEVDILLNTLLTEEERIVIKYKFGIGHGAPINSIYKIAKKLGLSVTKTKNLYTDALFKLQSTDSKLLLAKYLDN